MTCPPKPLFPLRATDVQLYRFCEELTAALIYFELLFSPWAFGTTQPWSIWTMNIVGYLLGLMLFVKLAIRHLKGYQPTRWDSTPAKSSAAEYPPTRHVMHVDQASALPKLTAHGLTLALTILTALILCYCLISAANARATYQPQTATFAYHDGALK